jgi:hypothetical protein
MYWSVGERTGADGKEMAWSVQDGQGYGLITMEGTGQDSRGQASNGADWRVSDWTGMVNFNQQRNNKGKQDGKRNASNKMANGL